MRLRTLVLCSLGLPLIKETLTWDIESRGFESHKWVWRERLCTITEGENYHIQAYISSIQQENERKIKIKTRLFIGLWFDSSQMTWTILIWGFKS